MEPQVKFVVKGLYIGLEEGTYRLVITNIDPFTGCSAIYRSKSGEENPITFKVSDLERELGCEYFHEGDEFNLTVKDRGNTQEYVRIHKN